VIPIVEKLSAYLVTLGMLLLASTVFLAIIGDSRILVYLSVFTVLYLAFDLIFKPARRIRFDIVGAVLFSVWIIAVISTYI
jgi:predicted tellurium resistance membrane protein TerC